MAFDLWELAAREAIRDLVAAYNDAGDRAQLEVLAQTFAHFLTNLRFVSVTPEAAQTTSYFVVLGPDGPDHWGRYRDALALTAEGWRIGHPLVSTDAFAPDSFFL
jgi:hypothetical protein